MKKILVAVLLLLPLYAYGVDAAVSEEKTEKVIIVYDVFKHRNNSESAFLAIGGVSLGTGIAVAVAAGTNEINRHLGIQLASWGMVETAVAIFDKNRDNKERDPEKARQEIVDFSGMRLWFDLAVFAAGACMVIWGDTPYKGHGAGLMINSAVLSIFDGVNLAVASDPGGVRDWGSSEKKSQAGMRFMLTHNGIRF